MPLHPLPHFRPAPYTFSRGEPPPCGACGSLSRSGIYIGLERGLPRLTVYTPPPLQALVFSNVCESAKLYGFGMIKEPHKWGQKQEPWNYFHVAGSPDTWRGWGRNPTPCP